MVKAPKVAIVHDWLTNMGGAEPVVLELHKLFPDAPVYTSVYDKKRMKAFHHIDVRTTWMQRVLPKFLRYKHPLWPVLRSYAFRSLDLSEFDVIISSSSAEAKSVRKTRPGQVHIAYIHTPVRYYYSHAKEFKNEFNFGPFTWFIRPFIPLLVRWMRKRDLASISGIDVFIANSTVTRDRIKQYYKKPSTIVYPPVEIDKFAPKPNIPRSGYIMWGRHVPYKRFDLAVKAANKLNLPLTVAGTGADTKRLKSLAGASVEFIGRIDDKELIKRVQHSKGFLFPNEEDFGITAAEALAAGTPIIAFNCGGSLDIVQDGETGVMFEPQTVDALIAAIKRAETYNFSPATLHRKSKRFSPSLFDTAIRKIVRDSITA